MKKGMGSIRFVMWGVCLSLLTCFKVDAKPLTTTLKWTHFGLRPLGMGNAFVSVVDDYNALFYNPAGLARLKDWDGEFTNPSFYIAANTQSFIGELVQTLGSGAALAELLRTFSKQSGLIHSMGLSMTPHFVSTGWGFGVGIDYELGLTPIKDTSIDIRTGFTAIAPVSMAWSMLEDRLSLGASVKVVARGGIDDNLGLQTLGKVSEGKLQELFQSGAGGGLDLGLLMTPIEPLEPTIGISLIDFGGTVFQGGESAPAPRKPTVNTGFSFKPYKTNKSYMLVAFDGHALNHPVHFSKKFNMGLEWGYSQIIKLQTGLSQGYLTGGLQFDVGFLSLRLASWAVDHGVVV